MRYVDFMARALRVQVPGCYHVVSRGNNRQEIFDDILRTVFLFELDVIAGAFGWDVYAWAFMSNHLHLVIEIHEPNLATGMHRLNTWLARASNARFGRINHCVGDRYWSTLIESERQLYASIRYTLWNPARTGIVESPIDSRWTSFRASAGLEPAPRALALARLLAYFGNAPAAAHRDFHDFVLAGEERCLAPWQDGAGIVT
jgi:REP element-mobilizing transposase RayT